jgi:hypothetical protein
MTGAPALWRGPLFAVANGPRTPGCALPKIFGFSDLRHKWSANHKLVCWHSRLRPDLNLLKEAFMSAQAETRAANPKPSSSTMPRIAVVLLVGAIVVALTLSISMGVTGEPQAAGYSDSVALP